MNLIITLISFLCLAGQGLPSGRQTTSDLDKLEHRAHRLLSPTRYPRRTAELDKLDATGLVVRAGTVVRLAEVARDPPNANNGTMGVYGRIEATTEDAVDRWMRGLERR